MLAKDIGQIEFWFHLNGRGAGFGKAALKREGAQQNKFTVA